MVVLTATALISLAYSALLILGGIFAFTKKQSVPSLVGGVSLGLIYLFAALRKMSVEMRAVRTGRNIALGASVILLALGVWRYSAAQKKQMPMMFMALGALGTLFEMLLVA